MSLSSSLFSISKSHQYFKMPPPPACSLPISPPHFTSHPLRHRRLLRACITPAHRLSRTSCHHSFTPPLANLQRLPTAQKTAFSTFSLILQASKISLLSPSASNSCQPIHTLRPRPLPSLCCTTGPLPPPPRRSAPALHSAALQSLPGPHARPLAAYHAPTGAGVVHPHRGLPSKCV